MFWNPIIVGFLYLMFIMFQNGFELVQSSEKPRLSNDSSKKNKMWKLTKITDPIKSSYQPNKVKSES